MIVDNANFRRRNFQASSRSRHAGMGLVDPGVNSTTIWTRSTGFLTTPGVVTAADYNTGTPGYESPTLMGPPACSLDPNPFVSSSGECIAQLLANQQKDMGQRNNSNYNVDLFNCLNQFPQPSNCHERTFGLTPVGGFNGGLNILTPNAQQLVTGIVPTAVAQLTSTPPTQTPTTQKAQQDVAGTSDGTGISNVATELMNQAKGSIDILGMQIPIWALGVAGVGLVFVVMKGGR